MNIIIPILQIHKQAKGGYIPVQGHTEGKWRLKPESGLPRFAFLLSHFYLTCEIYVPVKSMCSTDKSADSQLLNAMRAAICQC